MDSAAGDYRERLDGMAAELDGVNRRLERLYDAVETGSLTLADLGPRIRNLRERQEQLQMTRADLGNLLSDRRVELADLTTVTEYVADLHGTLNEGSLAERKSFVKSFVKEVRITGDQALLVYNMPLSAGRVSQESLAVPPIVHYGGRYWT